MIFTLFRFSANIRSMKKNVSGAIRKTERRSGKQSGSAPDTAPAMAGGPQRGGKSYVRSENGSRFDRNA